MKICFKEKSLYLCIFFIIRYFKVKITKSRFKRIDELEVSIREAEKRFICTTDSDNARFHDALNKLNLSFNEEKSNFLIQ